MASSLVSVSTLHFRGLPVKVSQLKRPRTAAHGGGIEEDNTGWQVWECSNVLLRYAAGSDETALSLAARPVGVPAVHVHPRPSSIADLRWLDVSAGAGLLACALAMHGAACVASETDTQLPQLELNVANTLASVPSSSPAPYPRLSVLRHYWGEALPTLRPPWVQPGQEDVTAHGPWYDVALVSDVLFIALGMNVPGRAQYVRELSLSLRALTCVSTTVVMAWEERLMREEQAFIESLQEEVEGHAGLDVSEVPSSATVLAKEDRLLGVAAAGSSTSGGGGGTGDDEEEEEEGLDGVADTFWEPPPVRIVLLRKKTASGS